MCYWLYDKSLASCLRNSCVFIMSASSFGERSGNLKGPEERLQVMWGKKINCFSCVDLHLLVILSHIMQTGQDLIFERSQIEIEVDNSFYLWIKCLQIS